LELIKLYGQTLHKHKATNGIQFSIFEAMIRDYKPIKSAF